MDAQVISLPATLPNQHAQRRWLPFAWSASLLAILGFLVLYPTAMLLIGALTTTNLVVEGYRFADLSVVNFLTVAANPNVAAALTNSLVACGGGTLLAVAIGLSFAWVVVRTNTPARAWHPNVGKLWLDWNLSDDGQIASIRDQGNVTSLRNPPIPTPDFNEKTDKLWKPKFSDFQALHDAWLDDWNKIYGYRQ